MDILLRPDTLSLSGSMNRFVIATPHEVTFVLKHADTDVDILVHTYTPNKFNRVEVNLENIIPPMLSFELKDVSEVYKQASIVRKFKAVITEIGGSGAFIWAFSVLRAGIDRFADSAANFLQGNFLTWQPTVKPVTYYTPEFLTYYALTDVVVKCRAYVGQDGQYIPRDLTLALLEGGNVWTIPVQYGIIAGKTNSLPSYYDVWIEDSEGTRLTYIQRYYASNIRSEEEAWVIFENSLGGVDTFRAYGKGENTAKHTHNIAEIENDSEEYRVDTEREFKKNTGYLSLDERKWLLDFFPSLGKFIYVGTHVRKIIVTDSDVSYLASELPSNYTFTYRYADARPYLNLPRTDLPAEVLDIKIPDVGSFTVAPRLVELPRLPLSSGALFPVQSPYAEQWGVTTVAAILEHFVREITSAYQGDGSFGHAHSNISLLNALTLFGKYLLVKAQKISAGLADYATEAKNLDPKSTDWLLKILRKDQDDSTPYGLKAKSLTAEKGLKGESMEVEKDSSVGGDQRVQGEARFGADPSDSLLDGRGTIIEDDRVQTTNMQVRGTLTVLDMVASQIHSLDGYYYFSDAMKTAGVEQTGENVYKITFERQYDEEMLKFYPADILLSIKTDLTHVNRSAISEGGNRTPQDVTTTSWCRVLTTSEESGDAGNTLWASVEVLRKEDGTFYSPPQSGAYIARRGNSDTTDADKAARRASWCISVEEGRITYYINQTEAGTKDNNFGLVLGKLPDIGPIRGVGAVGEIGLYCKTLLYDRAVSVNWKGDTNYTQIEEGEWNLERAQRGEYRYTSEYDSGMGKTFVVQSKVTHQSCVWLCAVDGSQQEPRVGGGDWTLISGGDTIIRRRVQYAATATRDLEEGGLGAPVVWHDDQSQCGHDAFCPYLWARTLGYTVADPGGSVIEEPHLIGVWGETGELVRAEISDSVLSIGVGADGILQTASPVPFETSAVIYKGETALPLNLSRCQVVSEGLPAQLAVTLSQKDTHTLGIAVVLRDGLDFTASSSRMVKIRVDGTDGHTSIAYNRFVTLEVKGNRKGADGEKGDPGKDGRGIVSVVEYYAVSDSRTEAPTAWQTNTIPAQSAAKPYLWNYEEIRYTTGEPTLTPPAVIGTMGEDGRGISSVVEHYLATTASTGVTRSTAGWGTGVQHPSAEKPWLWNYEKLTYTDGSTSMTEPVIIGHYGQDGRDGLDGLQGPKGDQGIPGVKGADGKTSYTHIAYADTQTGGSFSQSSEGKAYIGIYVDFVQADSTDPTKYRWTLIKGADGADGLPGAKGADGKTPYFHTAYSSSADGTVNFHLSDPTGRTYIGTYTDYTQADSTSPSKYKWVLIKGDKGDKGDKGVPGAKGADGRGVASVVEEYAVSASNTTAPTSWGTSVPTMTAATPYLWNRERFVYTDGTQSGYTPPAVIGSLGADGKGIKSVTEHYLATTAASGVTASTAGWTTSVQSMTAAKPYLWNYERVVYTDNSATATAPVIIGHYGKDGAKGEKGDKGAGGKYREHVYCLMKSDALAPARPLIDAQNWSQHSATAVGYTPAGGSAVAPSPSSAIGGVNVSANNATHHPSGGAYTSLRTEGWHGWVRVNGDVAAANYDYANRASLYSASAGQIYCMLFWGNKPQSPSKEWPVVYESFRWVDPGAEQPYGDFSAPVVHSRYGQDAVVYTLVPSRSAVTRAWNGQQATLDTSMLRVKVMRTEGASATELTGEGEVEWEFDVGGSSDVVYTPNLPAEKSLTQYAAGLSAITLSYTSPDGAAHTLRIPVIDQGRKGDRGYPGCISRLFENELINGKTYYNDTEAADKSIRFLDFVAVEVPDTATGWLVWTVRKTFTFSNNGSDKLLAGMTATTLTAYMNSLKVGGANVFEPVDTAAASAFFVSLVAKNANIRMLTGSHFAITDNQGKVMAGMGNRTANDGKKYVLWGGGETGDDATYRVDVDGTLHATTGEFSGLVKRKTLVLTAYNAASHIRKGYAPSSGQAQCLLLDLDTIPSEMCLYDTETHTGNGGDVGGTTQSPAGWAGGYPNMGEIPGWEANCAYLELPTLVYSPSTYSTWMSGSILGWEAYKGWCAANGRNVNPGVAADPLADTVWADWCRKYRAERIRRAREMVGCRMTIYQESSFGVRVSGAVPEGMYTPTGSNDSLYQVRELLYNREFGGSGINTFPHSFVELECRREVVYGAEHIYWTYTAGSCPVLDKEILRITDKT